MAEIERREQFKADAATQTNSTGGVFGLVSGASAADLDVIEERARWANFTERNPGVGSRLQAVLVNWRITMMQMHEVADAMARHHSAVWDAFVAVTDLEFDLRMALVREANLQDRVAELEDEIRTVRAELLHQFVSAP